MSRSRDKWVWFRWYNLYVPLFSRLISHDLAVVSLLLRLFCFWGMFLIWIEFIVSFFPYLEIVSLLSLLLRHVFSLIWIESLYLLFPYLEISEFTFYGIIDWFDLGDIIFMVHCFWDSALMTYHCFYVSFCFLSMFLIWTESLSPLLSLHRSLRLVSHNITVVFEARLSQHNCCCITGSVLLFACWSMFFFNIRLYKAYKGPLWASVRLVMSSSYIGFWFCLPAKMDPKQPVVLQLLESLKDSYMSNDFKTCQQLLGQLKVGLIHSHFRSSDTFISSGHCGSKGKSWWNR